MAFCDWLLSLMHHIFRIRPCGSTCQNVIPFYCQMPFHCMSRQHFISTGITWWPFGLFPLLLLRIMPLWKLTHTFRCGPFTYSLCFFLPYLHSSLPFFLLASVLFYLTLLGKQIISALHRLPSFKLNYFFKRGFWKKYLFGCIRSKLCCMGFSL